MGNKEKFPTPLCKTLCLSKTALGCFHSVVKGTNNYADLSVEPQRHRGTEFCTEDERGFALLLTIFIITVASILVIEFADTVHSFQRSSRNFSDQVRGIFMLKSAVNIGKMLIEAPKPPQLAGQDSLIDPWAMIGSAPTIPIEGFPGDLRLEITDEDSKLDLNSLVPSGYASGGSGVVSNPFNPTGTNTTPNQGVTNQVQGDPNNFFRGTFRDLFYLLGFLQTKYKPEEYRTLGDTGLEAPDQVAAIIDWLDADNDAFRAPGFEGQGIEGGADKTWFYNRPFRSLSELRLVPGMTLERVGQLARFVRVSQTLVGTASRAVNINTAPIEVLLALGMAPALAEEIVSKRLTFPYTPETLSLISQLEPKLSGKISVKSSEFMVLARVQFATRTLWARAFFSITRQGVGGKATLRLLEFY